MSDSRRFSSTYQSMSLLLHAENAHENVDWVKGEPTDGYVFSTPPLEIDADIETVWKVVKEVERYDEISDGAYIAHVDGELEVGKKIELDVHSEGCVKKLPHSSEEINALDDEYKLLGWQRKLPLTSNPTERYQLLEALPDNRTKSYIALRVPGAIGFFTKVALKGTIETAFGKLHQGIKQESEERSLKK